MNRPALMAQFAVFFLVIIGMGFIMIVLNPVISGLQGWQRTTYPTGRYDQNILDFFATTWYWWVFIAILIPMFIWAIIQAQKRVDPTGVI